MTKEQAFLNGFLKAANDTQIPPAGAPNALMPQQPPPSPGGQPIGQPGGQPGAQPPQPQAAIAPQPGHQPNQLFYQLLAQFKQQNPVPQVPASVPNMYNKPTGAVR